MCNLKLVGYSQQVTVNGTDTYSCMVEFAKNADDTTKMDMKIVGISPDKTEWNATVTTVPAEGCVRFAGTDSTDNYASAWKAHGRLRPTARRMPR